MKLLYQIIIIAILLFAHATMAWAEQQDSEVELIAAQIAELIPTTDAIFLDLRCGEWTPALSQELNRILLENGADIRQIRSYPIFAETNEDERGVRLDDYALDQARLVRVNMNIRWQTQERKSFFSYRTEQMVVYDFELRQLLLPEHRLIKIDTIKHTVPSSQDGSISAPRLRWFEPLIASTAIASIVFLLWTLE